MASRVAEAAASEGLSYNAKTINRQPNTTDAHRLIRWADASGLAGEMKQKLMDLYFRDGADLTSLDVLADAAASVGLDRAEIRARLASEQDLHEVTEEAKAATEAGISGVPTFIFGGKYSLSGAQPPEVIADVIRQITGKKDAAE